MIDEQIKGVVGEVAGKIQKAAGDISDNDKIKLEGAARELTGKAQRKFGEALDDVRAIAARKPVGAIAIGVGVGVLIGVLLARRD